MINWKLIKLGSVLVVLLFLVGYAGWQTVRVYKLQALIEKQKAEYSRLQAEHNQLVADSAQESLRLQQRYNRASQEAQRARENETQANRARDAAIAAGNDRLLLSIPGFATGNTSEASDSVTACRGRAETVGVLLGEAMRTAKEATAGAEQCGTDLRAVLRSVKVESEQ